MNISGERIFRILLIYTSITNAFYVDFDDYRHEINPEMVKYLNLRLIKTKPRNVINGTLMYKKDLDKFDVTFVILCPNRNGKRWTLMNVTVDGCDFVENSLRKRNKFPYIFLSELRSTNPDFPSKCPIQKDKEIVIRNLHVRLEKTILNFPDLNFHATVTLKQRGVNVFKLEIIGSLKN